MVESALGSVLLRLLQGQEANLQDMKGVPDRKARDYFVKLSQLRLRKTRGGVAPANRYFYEAQRQKDVAEKTDVALAAVSRCDPTLSIAAATGTTVALTLQEMHRQGIAPVVFTNSLAVLEYCPQAPQVHLMGGQYDPEIHATVGQDAERLFATHTYGQALVGAYGLRVTEDGDVILYVRHSSEVPILERLLAHVNEQIVIVANIQKIGRADSWEFGTVRKLAMSNRKVVLITNDPDAYSKELGPQYDRAKRTITALMHAAQAINGFEVLCVPRQKNVVLDGGGE